MDLEDVMKELGQREILSVMFEAGAADECGGAAGGCGEKDGDVLCAEIGGGHASAVFVGGDWCDAGVAFATVWEYGADIGMEFLVKR